MPSLPNFRKKPVFGSAMVILSIPLITIIGWHTVSALSRNEAKREISIAQGQWPSEILSIEEITGITAKDFPRGFSIKVKNISQKPIYYIKIAVDMPKSASYLNGVRGAFILTWGNSKLTRQDEIASAEDKAIAPGETCVLALSEKRINSFYQDAPNRAEFLSRGTSQLVVLFQTLSFGDGIYFNRKAHSQNNKSQASLKAQENSDCNRGILHHDEWCGQESEEPCPYSRYHCYDCEGGEYGQYVLTNSRCECMTLIYGDCPPSEG